MRSLIADYFTTFKDELMKHQKHYNKYEKVAIYHSRARGVYNKQEKRMMELKRQERMLQTEIENEQKALEKTKANTNVSHMIASTTFTHYYYLENHYML